MQFSQKTTNWYTYTCYKDLSGLSPSGHGNIKNPMSCQNTYVDESNIDDYDDGNDERVTQVCL